RHGLRHGLLPVHRPPGPVAVVAAVPRGPSRTRRRGGRRTDHGRSARRRVRRPGPAAHDGRARLRPRRGRSRVGPVRRPGGSGFAAMTSLRTEIATALTAMRERPPLVHGIVGSVTRALVSDGLLAAGARPMLTESV